MFIIAHKQWEHTFEALHIHTNPLDITLHVFTDEQCIGCEYPYIVALVRSLTHRVCMLATIRSETCLDFIRFSIGVDLASVINNCVFHI